MFFFLFSVQNMNTLIYYPTTRLVIILEILDYEINVKWYETILLK